MADDIPGDPRETASRRRILGESDRESRRAMSRATEEAMKANRQYGGSRAELIDRGQGEWNRAVGRNATAIPEPPVNASREAATRNMLRAGRAAPVAEAAGAVGRRLAGGPAAAFTMGMAPGTAGAGSEDRGNAGLARGMAAKEGNRRDAARMLGLEAGRLDAAQRRAAANAPEEDVTSVRNQRQAVAGAPEEDLTSVRNQRRAAAEKTRPRPRPSRASKPEAGADELNATEALNSRERDRVMAYKTGGMVRGDGCAVRGKTKGRMT
jgi:hypothetical protein